MATDIKFGWSVEALNKAYRQGHMAAVIGLRKSRCPYRGEVVKAAWEAGWDDAVQAGLNDQGRSDDFWSGLA